MNILDKLVIDKKLLKQIDAGMIFTVLLLAVFSLLNVYSATHTASGYHYLVLQSIWIVAGSIAAYLVLTIDYSVLAEYSKLIYWLFIGVLFFTDFTSKAIKGASSWVKIGSIAIEPGELVKLGLLLMLSKLIYDNDGNINNIKNFFRFSMYAVIPMVLILIQPNIGMTLICFFITIGIFYVAGLNAKYSITSFGSVITASVLFWNSKLMKAYQKDRILSFLDPQKYKGDLSYQLLQSQIAIGSGGLTGKGFLKGTLIGGGYVPEAHTDFIFAVVGEEWGLIGAAVLIVLYSVLLYKIIKIARNSRDTLGSMICAGAAVSLLFSVLQNIGMTIGIMPIAGITLPFMSYGGSSILTNFITIGLVLNIGMRRSKINF